MNCLNSQPKANCFWRFAETGPPLGGSKIGRQGVRLFSAPLILALGVWVSGLREATANQVVVTTVYSTNQFAYAAEVSASDLLHGLTPVVSGWNTANQASPLELTDGIHGVGFAVVPGDLVQGAWTTTGATAEYQLGPGPTGLGFTISSVQSIADWVNAGFGNQAWKMEVKPVGSNYVTLTNVDYEPLGTEGAGTTKVTLTSPGGVLASGIEAIKITANQVNAGANGGAFIWRELDVFGSPGIGATAVPLRIVCMGDSITAGYTDNPIWNHQFEFGYRSGLYTLLTNAGFNFRLVGGSPEPWSGIFGDPTRGGTYTPPLDLRNFGQDGHRGYGGQTVSYLNSNISSWLATDNPDIILLMIGTNSKDPTGLDTLVNTITTNKPNCQLIIAQIIPRYTYDPDTVTYNTYIRNSLFPKYKALGRKVTLVDQYAPFLTNRADLTSIETALFSNGINHPDNNGYDKMARVWFAAIEALNSTNITWTLSGTNLSLTWPADHIGWTLLTQTNRLNLGVSANTNDWMRLAGTTATNQFVLPLNSTSPSGFFRLIYP